MWLLVGQGCQLRLALAGIKQSLCTMCVTCCPVYVTGSVGRI